MEAQIKDAMGKFDDWGDGFFGDIPEHRVIFCIDTSGSMHSCLATVKDHLIRALKRHASNENCDGDEFNLIEFSSNVVKWAEHLVSWTEQTVMVAEPWIRNLMPKSGTNMRDALLAAFGDANCDAIYLVTNSLPDQRTTAVVDAALHAAGSRPIHCFYIQTQLQDESIVSLLMELAMETYGSLHVVVLGRHGELERVTKKYDARMSPDGIVRTTSGNILSSAHRMCSVGTTVDKPLSMWVPPAATLVPHISMTMPPWPYHLYPWPYRYYHTLLEPFGREWTRFRPAKAWLKHAQDFVDSLSIVPVPGAGSMLVGTRVLARRHLDGLFYTGIVKSQLMDDKFLIELGPCKHGKFTNCEYQETFVCDIVSHADALRHPILVDDKVLAPWEPEGERYAPAIVIDGHEKRMTEYGEPDKPLLVTFYDGKTMTVPFNKALWIPPDLYERITFEIKLPRNVRKELSTQDMYPYYTPCGYPASGSLAFPAQFERHIPAATSTWLLDADRYRYPLGWNGVSGHGYPWMAYLDEGSRRISNRRRMDDSYRSTAEAEDIIPGTVLTKSQLNSKVMAQIMQNKMSASSGSTEENGVLKKTAQSEFGLKKSVSFVDLKDDSKLDLSDAKDSGRGSQVDLSFTDSDLEDLERDSAPDEGNEGTKTTRNIAVGTERSLSLLSLRNSQKSRTARHQRAWKYWKNDPAPSLHEPLHYGPYREGPFNENYEFPSTLLRDAKKNWANIVEWTSPQGRVVDNLAQYKYRPNVKDCLHMPRPPSSAKPAKQGPGKDISEQLGSHLRNEEQLAEMRRSYRQNQVLAREIGWQRRAADEEHGRQAALDLRKQIVEVHRGMEQARVKDQLAHADSVSAAKRQINEQLNRRFQQNAESVGKREALKIAHLSVERINRNLKGAQQESEKQQIYAQRQANREMHRIARIETSLARMSELDQQMAAQQKEKIRIQSAYIASFEKNEREAQRRKGYAAAVSEQTQAIWRSQVLP